MRVKCPHCLHNLDLPAAAGEGPLTCPDCHEPFSAGAPTFRAAPPVAVVRRAAFAPALDPEEYEEERQERRELRAFRHEERTDWRDERREGKERNTPAVIGFALGLACLLLTGGGLLFGGALPVYLGFALSLSLPGALAGLILSVVGLLFRRVMRHLALAGTAFSGLLLVLLIPLGFLLLKG
jgi:hypothetical protein